MFAYAKQKLVRIPLHVKHNADPAAHVELIVSAYMRLYTYKHTTGPYTTAWHLARVECPLQQELLKQDTMNLRITIIVVITVIILIEIVIILVTSIIT